VLISIAALSVFIQILTVLFALRLIRLTGGITAWIFLSIAIVLMSARRIYYLFDVLLNNAFFQTDVSFEILGLATSLFMFVGVVLISPIFKTIRQAEENQRTLANDLKNRLARIKTLSAMLPICSYCKKIRDDKGYWEMVETYISKNTDTLFSHSICPECAEKVKKEVEEFNEKSGR
jgi:hypothetical protein